MSSYEKKIDLRWSDLDPNFHLRHSVYYDFGAYIRISFLHDHGMTDPILLQNHFGPILFREECIFRRELRMGDDISIDLHLVKAKSDFARWTIQHQLKKEGVLAAVLTVEGAWMDTQTRKLTALPLPFREVFEKMPRTENFEWNVK
jgi:acyl-CoA thioester hydrolase